MKTFTLIRTLALVVLLALVAGACGSDSETGGGVKVKRDGKKGDAALRDDRTTTTAAAAATTTPTTAAKATTTTRPPTTTTAKPVSEIKIQDDQQGNQFEPRSLTVRAGRTVRWVNVGNSARSVEADNGAFRSPLLQPGQSYEWVAKPGSYNYHDGTRPYAVGVLSVQ